MQCYNMNMINFIMMIVVIRDMFLWSMSPFLGIRYDAAVLVML